MKILIVDDHVLIREALRRVLRDLKGEATLSIEAPDSWHAMRQINQNPDVDLVVLDLGLPDRDGFEVLAELDERYPTTDYIMKQHVKDTDDPSFEFWYDGDGKMERPFYRSLVCTTRVSRAMLKRVKELHDSKKTLVFIEIMFNTLAVKYGMTMEMPKELQNIIFRHTWTEDTVNKDEFFHPVKDTALHDTYRERLAQQAESSQ